MRAALPLSLTALTLLFATAARAERTALLQPEGTTALTSSLAKELARSLAKAGHEVLSPAEALLRLRAAPKMAAALKQARPLLSQAGEAHLSMKRADALKLARRAVTALEAVGARLAAPELLARAHGAVALALMLRPADKAGARAAFARALAVDPTYAPDRDRAPPRVRALARKAGQRRVGPLAPTSAALTLAADAVKVDRLVWIGAIQRSDGVRLIVVVFDRRDGSLKRHEHALTSGGAIVADATPLVSKALGAPVKPPSPTPTPTATPAPTPSTTPAPTPTTSPASGPTAPPPEAISSPWYSRWWVWTIAGVVVVGAAVGLGVGLSQSDEPSGSGWDVAFRF